MVHQATLQGYSDYDLGFWSGENPYSPGTLEFANWRFGWDLADRHEIAVVLMELHSKGDPETPEDTGNCGC